MVSQIPDLWLRWLLILGAALALLASSSAAFAAPATPTPSARRSSGQAARATPQPTAPPAHSTISGVVLLDADLDGAPSPGDRPVVGLTVRLNGGPSLSGVTGASGTFAFEGLPIGTYGLSVALPSSVVPLNGATRTVAVNGRDPARVDFFVTYASPPKPTATPTPSPEPTETADAAGSPGASDGQRTAPPEPVITTLQGLRFAPGRSSPSRVEPTRTENAYWLGVPFISQLDGSSYAEVNCGPASTAMVLAAFGLQVPPSQIRGYVNSLSGVWGRDQGTSLAHLSRVVQEAGLEVSDLYAEGGGYRRWSTDRLREEIEAGRPVVTLVKYRALPGHAAARVNWDHYIVITGLAGDDFIYNDAAYASSQGYGLLIGPRDLEQAWDYSSIPRHGMAVGLPAGAETRPAPPSDETGLAQAGAELGEELDLRGGFQALLFRRLSQEPEQPRSSAPFVAEASLELGGFVDGGSGLALAGGGRASLVATNPVAPALPPLVLPLAAVAVGLGVGLAVVVSRRGLD